MMQLPGLIDVHVHVREPGATHKEDWDSATAAALAGGFTTILAMPNTTPAITSKAALQQALQAASKARCDYAQFVGAASDNSQEIAMQAGLSAGLKMYLDATFGPLLLRDLGDWMAHFVSWPRTRPIAIHAEGQTLAAVIALCAIYDRPVHLCHVSRRQEILLIKAAKERGLKVTCEVTPHHLFLTDKDQLAPGFREVRPVLNSADDQQALWQNLEVIDCFATDHAPHTEQEKQSSTPPPGFPGLETALPLLLTAVHQGRLSYDQLRQKLCDNPKKIFGLPEQAQTYIEVDPDYSWKIGDQPSHSRCGWSPFAGHPVQGIVRRVILRGEEVFCDGKVLAKPGTGQNVRSPLP